MGVHPKLLADLHDTDAAIAAALDLSKAAAPLLELAAPSGDSRPVVSEIAKPIAWWIQRMGVSDRLVEERLVWFWHDHFATSLAKVREPYLMWQQHVTLRTHATGNFAEMLHAVARDPAMILYLDGITNAAQERNENFGRECLELFTMGRDGGYTQDDVVAAAQSFTGWIVNLPNRPFSRRLNAAPWSAVFLPQRHDSGTKTLLGKTGTFDMDGALDVILDHPATARFVSSKMYRELVGSSPDDKTVDRLAKTFRKDYAIMPLVEAIVGDDAFVSDDAVRAKYRTPIEKLVGILQASGTTQVDIGRLGPQAARRGNGLAAGQALRTMSFLPFLPPNVGGFPKGPRLLGPHSLVHTFDLLQAVSDPVAPARGTSVDDLFAQFGIFDVSDRSHTVVAAEGLREAGRPRGDVTGVHADMTDETSDPTDGNAEPRHRRAARAVAPPIHHRARGRRRRGGGNRIRARSGPTAVRRARARRRAASPRARWAGGAPTAPSWWSSSGEATTVCRRWCRSPIPRTTRSVRRWA